MWAPLTYISELIIIINGASCMRIREIIFLSCFLPLLNCTDAGIPPDYELENAVFTHADYLIITGIPGFDSVTTATPIFTWNATGQKLVFLGIFNDNIVIYDNEIDNVENNIWAWHTGLGTGREGSVRFEDGRDVINGELQENEPPTPLTSGDSYTWAVWAWDDEGLIITHSSQEMFFTVE